MPAVRPRRVLCLVATALSFGAPVASADDAKASRASVTEAELAPELLEDRPPVMTLDQALAFGREHQPTFAAAKARLEAAQLDARVPDASWLPRIGAVAEVVGATVNNSTAAFLTNGAVDLARVGSTHFTGTSPDWTPYLTTLGAVGLRQQVWDFGRTAAQSAAALALADLERTRLAGARLELDWAIAQAYYAVLASRAVLEASEQAVKRSRVHRDFAWNAVKSGLRNPIELTRAEADLARYLVGAVRARRGVRLARSTLAATVGSSEAQIDAEDLPEDAPALPRLDDATNRAMAADPSVRAADAAIQAEETRARTIRALLRPNLSLTASFSVRSGAGPASAASAPDVLYGGAVPYVPNYDVGLVLAVPIYEPTLNRQADAASARASAARKQAEAVRLTVKQGVRDAIERVRMEQEALVSLRQAADAARANQDQADARFKVGLGTSTELADAEALRTEAEIQLGMGSFRLRAARAALARVLAEER